MDLATLFGMLSGIILIGTGVFLGSIENSVPIHNFVSLNSIFIVLGGTLAATAVAFPMKEVVRILGLMGMVFKKPKHLLPKIVSQIVLLVEAHRTGMGKMVNELDTIKNYFLRDGVQFIIDDLEIEEIEGLLQTREFYRREREIQEANLMNKMGMFSPAFGLVGTLIGLVFMLFGMQNNDILSNATATLGSAMALALITTFYGIVLANLIFIPFSEKIKARNNLSSLESALIIEGIKMIYLKKHPIIVREHLNSFLPPRERIRL